MTDTSEPTALEPFRVWCARVPADYGAAGTAGFPELPDWARRTNALVALRSLLRHAGLDATRFGATDWNPMAVLVRPGEKVVLKPNWVRHYNGTNAGLDCLVTHTTVLEAILHYLVKASPGSIVIGDAPIQGCQLQELLAALHVPEMIRQFADHGHVVRVADFRRTVMTEDRLGAEQRASGRSMDEFVLCDVGRDSVLEPITKPDTEFRVTMYHPDYLKRTHAPGKHQYLIAREVLDADVVISVPKLKTHKKACLTGALKNMVGINGHKEYLPHHRKGGGGDGGDCYAGSSAAKRLVENLLDITNRSSGKLARQTLSSATLAGMAVAKLLGNDNNYEGSWAGNDTVWRTCLDLQRVLHYGRPDGTLGQTPQRRVVTITDAIIAGEGDGPMSPTPVDLGLLTLGTNTAALEWVHALLLGMNPAAMPLTREAFASHRLPLTTFRPAAIRIAVDGTDVPADDVLRRYGRRFRLPRGWEQMAAAHVAPAVTA